MTIATDDPRAGAAFDAVRAAGRLTVAAQGRLAAGDTLTKGDDSPVTIADFGAQAIVCSVLTERLGDVDIVGEEDSTDLELGSDLLAGVTDLVATGVDGHNGNAVDSVDEQRVLDWIAIGSADASSDTYWTLDPIDGTKGFLRGDQYAIALALIEHGEVTVGALGCPNLPNADGTTGAVFVATRSGVEVYVGDDPTPRPVSVDDPQTLANARFCESVESGHSDHGHSAQIAERLGITTDPYRIDSQCKYAAVARGDASIYLRLPTRPGYQEKIWDHAAGLIVVEQAGGTVTDVDGRPLDFTHGARLSENRGIVATSGGFHDDVIAAVQAVLS